jgi:hypothetical protein
LAFSPSTHHSPSPQPDKSSKNAAYNRRNLQQLTLLPSPTSSHTSRSEANSTSTRDRPFDTKAPSINIQQMSQLSFMQLQTQSAPKRPLAGHSDSSSSCNSSRSLSSSVNSGSSTPKNSLDIVRCSRCQRSLSIDPSGRQDNVVRFGMNSFYCNRCATVVGYLK